MSSIVETAPVARTAHWAGYFVSALPAFFLLVDAVMKLFKPALVVEATTKLGYQANVIIPLGIVLLISTILYIIPFTAMVGAILLTGYLGGAVATHVRLGEGAFSILFPIILGVLLWGGLYLRNARLRMLIPLTNLSS